MRAGNLADSLFDRTVSNNGIFGYTRKQILDRAYIWGVIATSAAAAAVLDNTLRKEPSLLYMSVEMFLAAVGGGFLAHKQVRQPRVDHLKGLKKSGEDTEGRILNLLKKANPEVSSLVVEELIPAICKLSAKTADQANVTMTLVKCKNAMGNLEMIIANLEDDKYEEPINRFFESPLNAQLNVLQKMKSLDSLLPDLSEQSNLVCR